MATQRTDNGQGCPAIMAKVLTINTPVWGREKRKMQLPAYKPSMKRTFKCCVYLGCGKEFYGRTVQKYCEFHTIPQHRKRLRPKPESPSVKNQILFHHFHKLVVTKFVCALDGCSEPFQVNLYPKQSVYPKYCARHRSEYQRRFFTKMHPLHLASRKWAGPCC